MSLQSQYVIGLCLDVNPTKNQCRHNIGCPLGFYYENCIMKNCFNDKANLYVYKFNFEISTIANEITKFQEQ